MTENVSGIPKKRWLVWTWTVRFTYFNLTDIKSCLQCFSILIFSAYQESKHTQGTTESSEVGIITYNIPLHGDRLCEVRLVIGPHGAWFTGGVIIRDQVTPTNINTKLHISLIISHFTVCNMLWREINDAEF